MITLHRFTLIPVLFFKLSDCVSLVKSMPFLENHLAVLVLFIQAIFTALVGKPLLL